MFNKDTSCDELFISWYRLATQNNSNFRPTLVLAVRCFSNLSAAHRFQYGVRQLGRYVSKLQSLF